MTRSVNAEAQQRNGIAVRRMFHRDANQRLRAGALVTRERATQTTAHASSNRYDCCEATGPSFRVAATSAAALVGAVSGSSRPAWASLDGRELLQSPSLDAPSHLSRQLALSAEMGILKKEDQQALLLRASPVQQPPSALRLDEVNGADRSCFVFAVQKAHHAREVKAPDLEATLHPHEASKGQWKAYHHQQAVLRYENTLPRRRALDPYVQLTGAQVSAGLTVPNTYTADVLAKRNGGRWVLDNQYRQQLYRGEPVMTAVMRGDFYAGGAAQQTAGKPRRDIMAKNRRDVRVASIINRSEHRQRQRFVNSCACTE
ncbi:hypothetical protein ABL78_2139 [Leptomonas seymouri]|uniref:Uncharacterized protein n=1 Tax=Leptomonas seymouri TaxID=5684 RepID=A0A0N1I7Y3_LEPSE|nr:hypothetical protein ABL78_2139 [Leptomonas seymouri]|eukprot:KPI88760.1 hypothetical protein ABL78_2139 [Leptomonas seymouri]